MKISIAMATYNGSKYVLEQLESFANQTRLSDELIVSDDCSTDNTLDIVEKFSRTAPFKVKVYQNSSNLGYAQNFDKALSHCTGDLIFLSDQDDVWFPEKVARIASVMHQKPKSLLIMNDAELTDSLLCSTGLTKLGQLKSAGFSDESFVMGCCVAIHRTLLDLLLPIPEVSLSHDNWLVEVSSLLGIKKVVPEVLQCYRQHSENSSDFFINRTKKVSRVQVFSHRWYHILRSIRSSDSLTYRLAIAQVMNQRLKENYHCFSEVVGKSKVDSLIDSTSRTISVFSARLKVRQLPKYKRARSLYRLLRADVYQQASGIRSLLRDLVA